MVEIEEDIEELESLDLNEMISENNQKAKNIEKNQLLSEISKSNNQEKNPLLKMASSFDADAYNYLIEVEEANLILSDNFILSKGKTYKDKEKESLTEIFKSTIQRSRHTQSNEGDNDESLISTLKIDIEKRKKEKKQFSNSSYTGSIISNIAEGLEIGSYTFDGAVKIAKLLGEGAQAKVYLGVTEDENKEEISEQLAMAIKHFSFDVGKKKDEVNKEIDSLVNKCQTLKELSHDNIIQYFDCESEYKEDNQNFVVNIAMEYQETNLTEFIKNYASKNKMNNMPINLISKITKKIIRALIYLHEHKIIHRDLKPENILMSAD